MAQDQRKIELTAELASARSRFTQTLGGLRSDLDVPGRLKNAVRKNPAFWVGGATLFGVLLSRWPRRGKKVVVMKAGKQTPAVSAGKAGLLLGALKIAFDLSRPALAKWVGRRMADYMDGSGNNGRSSH